MFNLNWFEEMDYEKKKIVLIMILFVLFVNGCVESKKYC